MNANVLWAPLCAGALMIIGCAAVPEEPAGEDELVGASNERITGGTCDPSRAVNAVNDFQKALHDSIAYAEGTRGHSKDGYDVMFSFKLFSSCQSHPNQCLKFGSTCSTAAGRYQFLNKTWNSVMAAKNLDSFEPENQERGAAYLIATVRKVSVPQDRAMTSSEFTNAMNKLSYEWASLPPGQYGQPTKNASQMWQMYSSLVGSASPSGGEPSGTGGSGSSTGGGHPAGTILTATGDVNLRSGPSTSSTILAVVTAGSSVQTVDSSLENGFLHVSYDGTIGYSSGKYYNVTGQSPDTGHSPDPDTGTPESGDSPACFCDDACQSYGDCCSDCGSSSSTPSCYCDSQCTYYGDCCEGCG